MEWNLGATVWKKWVLAVNEVLEVLDKTCVKWVEIDLAMHNSQQAVVLIDSQIFEDLLSDCLLILLTFLLRAYNEAAEDFIQSWMASLYEVAEIVDARRLVLDQN